MHTVLDIIRHYSGSAGKEDKDMQHTCKKIESDQLRLYKEDGTWRLDDNDDEIWREIFLIDLLYCPFCGVKLDEA